MARPTILVDSRVQEAWSFSPERAATVRGALRAGDYSLLGLEERVAVERKSLPDFVHTVVQERARFQRELKLLADYEAACVVVEATLGDILAHRYRSRAHPNSVLGAVLSLLQDFRVPVLFCGDRPSARQFAEAYLLRCYRKFQT